MIVVAMLMVTDKKDVKNLDNFKNQMMDEFLLGSEILELTDTIKHFLHESNMEEIDLLLGVQAWRRFIFQCPTLNPSKQANLVLGTMNITQYDSPFLIRGFSPRRPLRMRARNGIMDEQMPLNAMLYNVAAAKNDVDALNKNKEEAVAMAANVAVGKAAPPVMPERAMAMEMGERMIGRPAMKRKISGLGEWNVLSPTVKRVSTIVWKPALSVTKGEIDLKEWKVVLNNVATTYLVYVGLISDWGIEERTEEIVTMRNVYMEAKLKTKKLLLCEDDILKLPFSLINQGNQDVIAFSRVFL